MVQQCAHLGGNKISFNDKLNSSTTHTTGELGFEFNNAVLLIALTMVSTRSKRSSVVAADIAKYVNTGGGNFPATIGRHWPPMAEYSEAAAFEGISPPDP